jgi:hypothetical protein
VEDAKGRVVEKHDFAALEELIERFATLAR